MPLPRTNVVTLQPLTRFENVRVPVIPRISVPGEPHLQELSVLRRASAALDPTSQFIQAQPPPPPALIVNAQPDWGRVLAENSYVGLHRFTFLLQKYTAIGVIIISTWILWGRGEDTLELRQIEKNMAIIGVTAGVVATVGIAFGCQNHANDKNNAKYQTIRRIIAALINGILASCLIVFGIIVLSEINNWANSSSYELPAFSVNERTTNASVILGFSFLTLSFSTLTIIFGMQTLRKLSHVENRLRKQGPAAAYANPVSHIDAY